ncbi:MAG: sulfatase-like hydrolase/transferase, partial [Chloroflexota bacterium]|nr:sulfatase-like hydrolase/transferase [Chloroflexota bacterium]
MPNTRPNLLLLIPDQHRWDFGPWDPQSPLRMPNLASLAERGVQFDQAIVNSPLCAPMRASLASARSYGSCGVVDNGNDYPIDLPTFYQQLRSAGYQVCGTGKL